MSSYCGLCRKSEIAYRDIVTNATLCQACLHRATNQVQVAYTELEKQNIEFRRNLQEAAAKPLAVHQRIATVNEITQAKHIKQLQQERNRLEKLLEESPDKAIKKETTRQALIHSQNQLINFLDTIIHALGEMITISGSEKLFDGQQITGDQAKTRHMNALTSFKISVMEGEKIRHQISTGKLGPTLLYAPPKPPSPGQIEKPADALPENYVFPSVLRSVVPPPNAGQLIDNPSAYASWYSQDDLIAQEQADALEIMRKNSLPTAAGTIKAGQPVALDPVSNMLRGAGGGGAFPFRLVQPSQPSQPSQPVQSAQPGFINETEKLRQVQQAPRYTDPHSGESFTCAVDRSGSRIPIKYLTREQYAGLTDAQKVICLADDPGIFDRLNINKSNGALMPLPTGSITFENAITPPSQADIKLAEMDGRLNDFQGQLAAICTGINLLVSKSEGK